MNSMDKAKGLLIIIILFLAFGLVGRCDYENALIEQEVRQELKENMIKDQLKELK
jgi:hypothetical protein